MSVWQSHRQMHEGDQHPDLLTVVHNLGGKLSLYLCSVLTSHTADYLLCVCICVCTLYTAV